MFSPDCLPVSLDLDEDQRRVLSAVLVNQDNVFYTVGHSLALL